MRDYLDRLPDGLASYPEDFIGEHHRISLNSPLYRVLFAVASPKLVLRRAASTWGAIFKLGIELAGAKNVMVNVDAGTPTHGSFQGAWD